MTAKPCACVECRIRQAAQGIGPGDPPRFMTGPEMNEAIAALGNVMAEYLAHAPTREAKRAAAQLLEARKRWMKEPRVAVQLQAQGRA